MLKALVQKTISFLPRAADINLLFQRYVTRGVALDDVHLTYKVEAARDHLRFFASRRAAAGGEPLRVLELGTGWYPIVPLVFYLHGVGPVTSLDIRDWTSKENHLLAIRRLVEWHDRGNLQRYLPHADPGRLDRLRQLLARPGGTDLDGINRLIGLTTVVTDARHTGFAENSFDLICSNNTFEHIYPEVLADILTEFVRLAKRNAVMSHFVDLSDHFAHFDPSIDIYNFLRFSPAAWRLIDNDIQPQNRLRWSDYLRMYARLGVPVTATEVRPGSVALVRATALDATFRSYSESDLAISHGYIVSDLADRAAAI